MIEFHESGGSRVSINPRFIVAVCDIDVLGENGGKIKSRIWTSDGACFTLAESYAEVMKKIMPPARSDSEIIHDIEMYMPLRFRESSE